MRILFLLNIFLIVFTITLPAKEHTPTELKKYVFKFTGQITYKSRDGHSRGLYGARVILHMLKKGDGMIDQPTGIGLNPKDLSVPTQPDGSFTINVQMLANLSMFDQFFLEIYPGDSHGFVHYDSLQFITASTWGNIAVWNKHKDGPLFRGIKLSFDENKTNHFFYPQIKVMPNLGGAVRYLKISNEFGKIFFNQIGKKKSIPSINVNIIKKFDYKKIEKQEVDGYFDYFKNPKIINIHYDAYITEGTMAHEYGHYLHYTLNKAHLAFANNEYLKYDGYYYNIVTESLANFFAMAIQNYAKIIYNEADLLYNNLEKQPFNKDPFLNCKYCNIPDIPRSARMLWNIYDGPSQTYGKKDYIAYDNDDIDGEKVGLYKKIFDLIVQLPGTKGYKAEIFFKELQKATTKEIAASLSHMQQFLFGDTTHKMLPAQVKAAILSIKNYKEHYLQFQTYNYPEDISYKNQPDGYRLYGKKGNAWILITDIPDDGSNKYFFSNIPNNQIDPYKNFKITSYNKFGESLNPYEFVNSSQPISLEGPATIFADIPYQWKAKLIGDKKPVQYYWSMRKVNGYEYFVGKYPMSGSGIYSSRAPEGQSFILEVAADYSDGSTAYIQKLITTTVRPLKAAILGPSGVAANQDNQWKAEVTGGIPPYTYNWVKQTPGKPGQDFLSQTNSCHAKSDKPFTLKLLVKDSLGNSIMTEKPIQLNILAPINPTISGPAITYLHDNASTWKAEVTGGLPPYQIIWMKKYSDAWVFTEAGKGSVYQKEGNDKEGVFYLKTVVQDANGITKESEPFKVNSLYQPLYTVISNENVVLKAGEKITWNATIAGGKPAYQCEWKVGKDVNHLTVIKQENMGLNKAPVCEYQSKINDVGKYLIQLSVKDDMGKSMSIEKEFIVGGNGLAVQQQNNTNAQTAMNFSVYPNPASGTFKVEYKLEQDAQVTLSLVSTNTNRETLLYQQQNTKGTHQQSFNVGQLPIGNYILKLTQKDKNGRLTVTTEKVTLLQ